MIAHIFKPSTWEVEAGGYLWPWDQPGPHSGCLSSQNNTSEAQSQKEKQGNKSSKSLPMEDYQANNLGN